MTPTSRDIARALIRARTRSAIQVMGMLALKPKLTAKELIELRRAREEARLAKGLGL